MHAMATPEKVRWVSIGLHIIKAYNAVFIKSFNDTLMIVFICLIETTFACVTMKCVLFRALTANSTLAAMIDSRTSNVYSASMAEVFSKLYVAICAIGSF